MTTEWKGLPDLQSVAQAQHNGWEIERLSGGAWLAWNQTFWSNDYMYRGRPAQPKGPPATEDHWRHMANEWADAATNCIDWVRNIRDEISTPEHALIALQSEVDRVRSIGTPTQPRMKKVVSECWRNKHNGQLAWRVVDWGWLSNDDWQRFPAGDIEGEVCDE